MSNLLPSRRRGRAASFALSLTLALVLALLPRPAAAQVPGLPEIPGLPGDGLPGLGDLPSPSEIIEIIGDIEGLDPLDPILQPVIGIIQDLEDALGIGGETTGINAIALGGDDAVEAAIAFSRAAFPDGADTAVIGRDDLFADPMSSSGVQGVRGAPLLLTASEDLDQRLGMELQRLGLDGLTLLGGEDALNPLVVSKLEIAGLDVERIGGETRVETSVEVAAATAPDADHVVLVRAYPDPGQPDSQAYADLLAAGPYAAENGWPVLMTTSAQLHPAVAEALEDVSAVTIIGGTDAISASIESALEADGKDVDRVAGDNRFATAVAIANARGFESAGDADQLILAEQGGRDDVWAPGFAASAYGDLNRAPVLLADGDLLPAETFQFIVSGLPQNLASGGSAVVCAPFVSTIACELAGALVLGAIDRILDIIDVDVEDIPLIGDILDALGEAGLLPEEIQDVLDELIGGGDDDGDAGDDEDEEGPGEDDEDGGPLPDLPLPDLPIPGLPGAAR